MPLLNDTLLIIGLLILFLISIWVVTEIIFRIAVMLKFADVTKRPELFSLLSRFPIATLVTLVTAVALVVYFIAG